MQCTKNEPTIEAELDLAKKSMRIESDPIRWAALYAIVQALQWAIDENVAASPVGVVLSGRVQVPMDIPVEKVDCLAAPHLVES